MSKLNELMLEWLEILAKGDTEAWAGRVCDDIVLRFPFAPPGMAGELRGVEQARAAFLAWKSDTSFRWKDIVLWQTDEPGLVVATLAAEAELTSGQAYRNSYVMLTRFAENKVVEHVEYFNPAAVTAAIGDQ